MTATTVGPPPVTKGLVLTYVLSMIAANVTIAVLGAWAVIPVGLLLIGLNLVVRDQLHERLAAAHGRAGVVGGMAVYITIAGVASWLANPAAGRIALASLAAFLAAQLVDAIAYDVLRRRGNTPAWASTRSNIPASFVDSVTFLALAFPGPLSLVLVLVQSLAKIAGGAAWVWVLYVLPGQLARGVAAELAAIEEPPSPEQIAARDQRLAELHRRAADGDPTATRLLIDAGTLTPEAAATLDEAIRRDLGVPRQRNDIPPAG